MRLIERQSGGPMYQQLRQDLLARIRRGEFGPDDLLPSENQLCEHYGVSLTTVRRALLELVKEGVVRRRTGVGTMVAPRVRQVRLAFLSVDFPGDSWRTSSGVMGDVLSGIGDYAWPQNAALSVVGVDEDEAAGYLRGLVEERRADGVLLRTADEVREEYLEILENAGMPYVVIKRYLSGRPMNCVVADDVTGARMAMEHLLELGHRSIGFVGAKPYLASQRERLLGYRKVLEEAGVPFDEALVRQGELFDAEEGREAVRSLLELSEPPTAIFAASDVLAVGGYEAVQELGLTIPDDVSILGYDKKVSVEHLQPPLTAVRASYYDFGRLAAQLLLDLIEGRELAPQQRVIRPQITIRGSTRAVGAAALSSGPSGVAKNPEKQGRLADRLVVGAGEDEDLRRVLAEACEAEGAQIVPGPDGAAEDDEAGMDVFLCVLDPGKDLGSALREAAELCASAAGRMSERGGAVLLVARPGEPQSPPEHAALEAGLARLCETLAKEREGVRTNGLVLRSGEVGDLVGPATFLASDEAINVNGQTLALRKPWSSGTSNSDDGGSFGRAP